jgi:hypothetical protein
MTVERGILVKEKGQRLVYLDQCEVVTFLLVEIQTEDACKKASGRQLVARRHDGWFKMMVIDASCNLSASIR